MFPHHWPLLPNTHKHQAPTPIPSSDGGTTSGMNNNNKKKTPVFSGTDLPEKGGSVINYYESSPHLFIFLFPFFPLEGRSFENEKTYMRAQRRPCPEDGPGRIIFSQRHGAGGRLLFTYGCALSFVRARITTEKKNVFAPVRKQGKIGPSLAASIHTLGAVAVLLAASWQPR
jgi:hypothetical protein